MACKGDVLVVEDDPEINRLICAYLEHDGYEVSSVFNGADAVRGVQARVPGLLLLDVMLPDMDGFEVCRTLKADQRTAAVPVIMVTALTDDAHRRTGLGCGAAAYVTKPYDPNYLLVLIERHSKGSRSS
jgi:DNA-binding response OmpR family regulator